MSSHDFKLLKISRYTGYLYNLDLFVHNGKEYIMSEPVAYIDDVDQEYFISCGILGGRRIYKKINY